MRLMGMSVFVATILAAPMVWAAGLCVKPGAPVCMNDTTTFVSADKMQTCQSEVKDYADQTLMYLKCLSDEHAAVSQELKLNIEGFNCRLSGNGNCG